ncbi:hypothetical protein [Campylobacter troglodytis]|uniref:hypothetical protein n=1 Tax=Campylobacter troglodytis TaxID=654363 RepID=UPI00115891A8|nr:hypothetical protein [Campylobacter troglodytis]
MNLKGRICFELNQIQRMFEFKADFALNLCFGKRKSPLTFASCYASCNPPLRRGVGVGKFCLNF